MVWIKTIKPEEADQELADEYIREKSKTGFIPETTTVFSLKPNMLKIMKMFGAEIRSPDWKLRANNRETLAVVVSALEHCKY
ncbi:hypothetical protein FIM02_03045 [SAR202 cluster bacterium AD-802-E10_MRT_200m]|nr:hypothetical protein [SAR202 cluster bacterium AD-802-E10_MRT_200m]